jgi:hypothetical protein
MKTKFLFSIAVLLTWHSQSRASTFTNLVTMGSNEVASLVVRTGQVAKVIGAKYGGAGANGYLYVSVNGLPFSYATSFRYTIAEATTAVTAGPATISLISGNSTTSPMFCTVEITTPGDASAPTSAVVIPADSAGPVNIILESSTDLISWTAALPGNYGTSTEKRFFRVRAERAP